MDIHGPTAFTPFLGGQTVQHRLSEAVSDGSASDRTQPRSQTQTAQASTENGPTLSPGEQQQVEELQERDREVRTHEAAHQAAAGSLGSAPSYSYTQGPDGQRYAVSGEVNIDVSPVQGDPEATIEKAERIVAAATAPAQPSGQDMAVAASANAMAARARVELSAQQAEQYRQIADDNDQERNNSLIDVSA